MELFIILSTLIILGVILARKSYDCEFFGVVVVIISGMYLIIHSVLWSTSSYTYEKFVVERESLVETLEYTRENNNQIELASVTLSIIKFNKELASAKYDNDIFLLKDYIDDRVKDLKPIYQSWKLKNVIINGCGSESTSFECIIYNKGKMVAIASNDGDGCYSTIIEFVNNQYELNELIDEF